MVPVTVQDQALVTTLDQEQVPLRVQAMAQVTAAETASHFKTVRPALTS